MKPTAPPRTLIDSQRAEALVLSETIQRSPAGVVSRTLLQSPELRAVLFAFADGQELTTHSSRRRALIQILEGQCDFFFAGQWNPLSAGSVLHLPPGHPHAVKANSGPFTMLLTLGSELAEPDATRSPG